MFISLLRQIDKPFDVQIVKFNIEFKLVFYFILDSRKLWYGSILTLFLFLCFELAFGIYPLIVFLVA